MPEDDVISSDDDTLPLVASHTVESTIPVDRVHTYARHQLKKDAVRIFTDLASDRLMEISLRGRDAFIDTTTFAALMDDKGPMLSFSDTFHLTVLAQASKRMHSPSFVVDNIMVLDIREAKSITILPESLVDYAVGKDIPTTSINIEKLPYGIRVMKSNDLANLNIEVSMRSAVLHAICGSTKAGTKSDMLLSAAKFNTDIRLFSHSWASRAITISNDPSFLSTCHHALTAAGFDALEYISISNNSSTPLGLSPKRLEPSMMPLLGRSKTHIKSRTAKFQGVLNRSFTVVSRSESKFPVTKPLEHSRSHRFPITPAYTPTTATSTTSHASSLGQGQMSTTCFSPSRPSFSAPKPPPKITRPVKSHLPKSKEQWISKAFSPLIIALPRESKITITSNIPTPPKSQCDSSSLSASRIATERLLKSATSASGSAGLGLLMARSAGKLNSPPNPHPSRRPTSQTSSSTSPKKPSSLKSSRSGASSIYSPVPPTSIASTASPMLSDFNSYCDFLRSGFLAGQSAGDLDCGAHLIRSSSGTKNDKGTRPVSSIASSPSPPVVCEEVDGGIRVGQVPVSSTPIPRTRTRRTVESVMLGTSGAGGGRLGAQGREDLGRTHSYQFEFDDR